MLPELLKLPKISVISIARNYDEIKPLEDRLKDQTFQDFEFIYHLGGTIPEAWNHALSKVTGDYIVFTESDARPLNNKWLEEIDMLTKRGTIFKGIEISPTDLNMCNLVADSNIFKNVKFNESFKIAEDTELFARLRKKGIKIEYVDSFPVIHIQSRSWKKIIQRSLIQGMYFMKIMYLHGRNNMDDTNTRNYVGKKINPISNRIMIIVENALVLLGLVIGALLYLPFLFKMKKDN